MLRFLVIGLMLYIGYRIILSLISSKQPQPKSAGSRDHGIETHRDPICGLYISEETAVVGRHNGQRHYFCSMDCLEKYREQLEHGSSSG